MKNVYRRGTMEYRIFKEMAKLSLIVLVLLFGLTQACFYAFPLGATGDTIETLAYRYANDYEGLVGWVHDNLKGREHYKMRRINDVIDSNYANCREMTEIYVKVLDRGMDYSGGNKCVVKRQGSYPGHVFYAFHEYGKIVMLNNDNVIKTNCRKMPEIEDKYFHGRDITIYR